MDKPQLRSEQPSSDASESREYTPRFVDIQATYKYSRSVHGHVHETVQKVAGISKFEPLFPEQRAAAPLLETAATLIGGAHRLSGHAGDGLVDALRPLLRQMSSYYTNLIEGQHTRPADIERAMTKQFDADETRARKQRLAAAHIEVEEELELAVVGNTAAELFDPAFIAEIHERLYAKLPEADRVTDEGEPIEPGVYRTKDVVAGRHLPPRAEDVPEFMQAWADRYRRLAGNDALAVGAVCSHHRLAWVHPFVDGNGRTARLHTHLVFHAMGLTHGLWSPMRGLARTRADYYDRLNNADLPRRNDLDGRGTLSQEELVKFAGYFLDTCVDQVNFMREQLAFDSLKERMSTLLRHLQDNPWQIGSEKSVIKIEALEVLHYVAISGPLERGRFIGMTGVGDRTGRRVLQSLLDYGVLSSGSTRAPVAFALPHKSLRFLFPNLWPEAEEDAERGSVDGARTI